MNSRSENSMSPNIATDQVVDDIYQAAFDPDRWIPVLQHLTAISSSAATGIGILDEFGAYGVMDRYTTRREGTGGWQKSDQQRRDYLNYAKKHPLPGFATRDTYFVNGLPNRREIDDNLKRMNIGDQLGTIIPLPGGQILSVTSERWIADGRYSPALASQLDVFRPHLARAGILSASMGHKKAEGTMAMLDALALPAAMLSATGKVLEINDAMGRMEALVQSSAWGMLRLTDVAANKRLQRAMVEMRAGLKPHGQSIPVSFGNDRQILHLIPIFGNSRSLFLEARLLLAITNISASSLVPTPELLKKLYGLTESEARLASRLATGAPLQDCAAALAIGYGTARSYLLRIFRKTETRQQGELVALLKSTAQIVLPLT